MCIRIIRNILWWKSDVPWPSFEPSSWGASCSTAHGAQVHWSLGYMGRSNYVSLTDKIKSELDIPSDLVAQLLTRNDRNLLTYPLVCVKVQRQTRVILLNNHSCRFLDSLCSDSTRLHTALRTNSTYNLYALVSCTLPAATPAFTHFTTAVQSQPHFTNSFRLCSEQSYNHSLVTSCYSRICVHMLSEAVGFTVRVVNYSRTPVAVHYAT